MLLRPDDFGIHLNVGIGGSGKTACVKHGVRRCAGRFPILVSDPEEEWGDLSFIPPSVRIAGVRTIDGARRAFAAGVQLIVCRPAVYDVEYGDAAAAWAIEKKGQRGVVFPEAHFVVPAGKGGLSPNMLKLATVWRHRELTAWFDTQRFSRVHVDMRSAAAGGDLRIFAQKGPDDIDAAREIERGLDRAVERVYEEHFRFAEGCPHCRRKGCASCAPHRGWFVTPGDHEPQRERHHG